MPTTPPPAVHSDKQSSPHHHLGVVDMMLQREVYTDMGEGVLRDQTERERGVGEAAANYCCGTHRLNKNKSRPARTQTVPQAIPFTNKHKSLGIQTALTLCR